MTELILPTELRIGPHDFSVNQDGWRLAEGFMGYCDLVSMQIVVDPALPPLRMAETYIHEVLHGIWMAMGLEEKTDEETAVRGLALGILSFMRDNPNGFDMVWEALGDSRRKDLQDKLRTRGNFG